MKDSLTQLTKREWRTLRGSRSLWVGMLAAGAVLGLVGPFGTDESLTTALRVLYWVTTSIVTFITGYCIAGGLLAWARERHSPLWVSLPATILVIATLIYAEVLILNLITSGSLPRQIEITVLGANVLIIVAIITVAIYVIATGEEAHEDTASPRLLDRLPLPLRGPLVSLSVTDHYVHVTTKSGTHMLLMRLSDAMAETAPTAGFQIHRSHWVAAAEIDAVLGTSRKYEVLLRSGARLPLSRTYVPQLKEAGFLPKNNA